jgi:transcriptional regulator
MYMPSVFEERDPERLRRFIREHPFGTLVTLTTTGLDANHIPFLLLADTTSTGAILHGHIARANPLWRNLVPDSQVLVIFHGPDSYVSPSWYASTRETAKVVPTWNYAVVHAHGALRVVDDVGWLRSHVEALTQEHEERREAPWAVGDAPADFVDQLLSGIIGIEISVTRLAGKWKVSQNRSVADRAGVVEGLEREGLTSGIEMAALVKATTGERT